MTRRQLCWPMCAAAACAQVNRAPARTVLAVGAHAGDMEITTGALLARQRRAGDRVVLLHLTLGEGGNPRMPAAAYGEQKRREALAAGKALGADVRFGPYKDGELPDDEAARRYVSAVIAEVKPAYIFTHWKHSIHKDHAAAHAITKDAVLLASVAGTRGVKGVYYAENWEDMEGFAPYLFFDVTGDLDRWRECVTQYEFIRGGISNFAYLDYYESLARMRGALAGVKHAIAFDVESFAKRRILTALP